MILWDTAIVGAFKWGDVVLSGRSNDYHGPRNKRYQEAGYREGQSFFQAVAERDPQEMLEELEEIVSKEITEPYLKRLLGSFFNEPEFVRKFALAPAARTIHHNYTGGLLEHTLEVISICRLLATLYPQHLSSDLLFTGAILHDVGKLRARFDKFKL